MKIKGIVGFALGMVAGSMVTRLRDDMELKRESAPKKDWSEKTLKEKEAWVKHYENRKIEPILFVTLKRDLERQRAIEIMGV